jgi:hypothetical protein
MNHIREANVVKGYLDVEEKPEALLLKNGLSWYSYQLFRPICPKCIPDMTILVASGETLPKCAHFLVPRPRPNNQLKLVHFLVNYLSSGP